MHFTLACTLPLVFVPQNARLPEPNCLSTLPYPSSRRSICNPRKASSGCVISALRELNQRCLYAFLMNYTILFNAMNRSRNSRNAELLATSRRTATALQREKAPATLAAPERIPT
jgi:hypothetical protein